MHLFAHPVSANCHFSKSIDKAKPRAWRQLSGSVQARGVAPAFPSLTMIPAGDWHHDSPRHSPGHP
jgi:hypothetical protein